MIGLLDLLIWSWSDAIDQSRNDGIGHTHHNHHWSGVVDPVVAVVAEWPPFTFPQQIRQGAHLGSSCLFERASSQQIIGTLAYTVDNRHDINPGSQEIAHLLINPKGNDFGKTNIVGLLDGDMTKLNVIGHMGKGLIRRLAIYRITRNHVSVVIEKAPNDMFLEVARLVSLLPGEGVIAARKRFELWFLLEESGLGSADQMRSKTMINEFNSIPGRWSPYSCQRTRTFFSVTSLAISLR